MKIKGRNKKKEEKSKEKQSGIDRQLFMDALNRVVPALQTSDMAESTPGYIFSNGKIMSMNSQIAVSTEFKTELNCGVPSEELYKIIDKMKTEKIKLTTTKNNKQIVIKSDRIKSKINCFDSQDEAEKIMSILEEPKKEKYKKLPKNFVKGLRMCLFSVSADVNLPVLNCIFIDGDKIISSDEQRISVFTLDKKLEGSYLIPAKSAKKLIQYNVTSYYVPKSQNMIYFSSGNDTYLSCTLFSGTYRDCFGYFDFNGDMIEFPDFILEDLEIVSVMTDATKDISDSGYGEFENIEVEIDGSDAIMRSKKDIGSVTTSFKMKSKVKTKMKFKVNPDFLKEVLSKTKELKIGKDRVLFETDNYRHLVYLHT